MSPVLVQISFGGKAGLRCHIVPVLVPDGSQIASVAIVRLLPIAGVPVMVGAASNI